MGPGQIGVVDPLVGRVAGVFQPLHVVVEAEVIGDGDLPGALGGAVAAVGAGDLRLGADDLRHLFQQMNLIGRERLELLHIAGVVLQLLRTAHAAEDGQHPVQSGGKPDGPGGQAGGRVGPAQQHGGLLREVHQGAPLHRLHDHDLLAVFPGHLIALPGLDVGVLPVQVVDLELDQLGLRVVLGDLL